MGISIYRRGLEARRAKRRGFTLVESLITVLVVTIGAISTMSLLTFSRVSNSIEQERARAHQMVSDEMERVRLELFSRISAGDSVTFWDNGTPDNPEDDTQGTLEVRFTDPESGAELVNAPNPARRVQAEVSMTWNPRGSIGTKTLRESVICYLVP